MSVCVSVPEHALQNVVLGDIALHGCPGGIFSAAVDGIEVAEAVALSYAGKFSV